MKKFEIIRKADNVTLLSLSNIDGVPTSDIIRELPDANYSFKIDYKPKTQQQVLNFIENHAEEIAAMKPTDTESNEPVKVSKVSEIYADTYQDKDIPAEGVIVLYTRFMEDGRFKKTYTQIKTFDDVDTARDFIDKRVAKSSKYWVGAVILVNGVVVLTITSDGTVIGIDYSNK